MPRFLPTPRILFLLLSLCLVACEKQPYERVDGARGDFTEHRGQWMLINYWAIWCKPCIEEIPAINALAASEGDRLAAFAVNFDGKQGETLRQEIETLGIAFTNLAADPASVLGVPRPQVLPTTYVFDPEGKLHATLVGPQTEASLRKQLRKSAGVAN